MTLALSIVVPTLDEAASLPVLLASIRAEARGAPEQQVEVLVVDGGSADDTRRIARGGGARVLVAPTGRGAQLAYGAEEANGELLVFLHADARLLPGSLAAVRAAFEDACLSAAGMRQRVAHGRRVYRWIEAAADARVRRGMVYGDSGLCARRAAYRAVGGFRDLPVFEDVDLSLRLRRHGDVRLIEGACVEISARRWLRDGVVRRSVSNWILLAAYRAGVAPRRLARFYRPESRARRVEAARQRAGE